jgi:hypothetical protein
MAAGQVLQHSFLGRVGEAKAGPGCGEDERSHSEDDLAVDASVHFALGLLRFPSVRTALRRKRRLMQLCCCEVLSRLKQLMRREVGRCANNGRTPCQTQSGTAIMPLATVRRCGLGVEPFSDNIGQSVVDDDLDLEVQISSARTAPEPARERTHRPTERRLRHAKLRRCTAEDDQGLVLRDREVGRFHSDLRI